MFKQTLILAVALLVVSCAPKPKASQASVTVPSGGQAAAQPMESNLGALPTSAYCSCDAWCDSNFFCGNHHQIDCFIPNINDGTQCQALCSTITDSRCGSNCSGVESVTSKWIVGSNPTTLPMCTR